MGVTLLGTSCQAGGLVNFPYDPNGRSLNSPFAELTPRVSGRYIAFVSDRRGSQDIFLYDMTTRMLVDLPGLNAIDMVAETPCLSENGQYIAFHGIREGRSGIFLYDRSTRQLRNLTENIKAAVRNPSMTADGSTIAFESSASGRWDIVLVNRSGKRVTK
jgi:Tol biopolymer transport system component